MKLPNRKPQRLRDYDYTKNGYYFITICTHDRRQLFGHVVDGNMVLNIYGQIAQQELLQIPNRFVNTELIKFIVMPNHIHVILDIKIGETKMEEPVVLATVPKAIGLYKSGVARRIHEIKNDVTVWQKSYHDHIIRNDAEYLEIWQYIDTNPLKWELDKYYTRQGEY
ncbi:MAG: transposase [Firmicutes bacterium]|nr:transposase [Bacillota bacterium]